MRLPRRPYRNWPCISFRMWQRIETPKPSNAASIFRTTLVLVEYAVQNSCIEVLVYINFRILPASLNFAHSERTFFHSNYVRHFRIEYNSASLQYISLFESQRCSKRCNEVMHERRNGCFVHFAESTDNYQSRDKCRILAHFEAMMSTNGITNSNVGSS